MVAKPARLDTELVRRGLVSSRGAAKRAIAEGLVSVRGLPASRPQSLVDPAAPISLTEPATSWVSRGGEKLDAALERLAVPVEGRRWLDCGSSTGGFTHRLLEGGATTVIAVDVGYGQLDWRLRNDSRVVVLERTNARYLTPEDLPWPPEGVVADLSFISLRVVLPALAAVAGPGADFVLLVKPQFEVGRTALGRGGVVRDPALWADAVTGVVETAEGLGLGLTAVVASPLVGPAGNREFFVRLRPGVPSARESIAPAIAEAPA
jgi:23S rRNA (cytidine1920-2'-O)/16S rRNA (cytidine1409-2'-O)-methyltransferase